MDVFCSVVAYGEQETRQPELNLNSLHQWLWRFDQGGGRRRPSDSFSSESDSSQRPGQVAEVDGAPQAGVSLQQGHDDRHGRLVVAGAAGPGVIHDVYAQVGVVTWTGEEEGEKKAK